MWRPTLPRLWDKQDQRTVDGSDGVIRDGVIRDGAVLDGEVLAGADSDSGVDSGVDGPAGPEPSSADRDAGTDSHTDPGAAPDAESARPPRIPLAIPLPGRLSAATVRRYLAAGARLAILSRGATRLPGPVGAAWVAAWAAAVGLLLAGLLTVLAGAADPGFGLAGLVWLVAHHTPLTTDTGTVTLLPLALLLLSVLPLRRAGRFLVAQSAGPLRVNAPLAAIGYVAIAVVIALSHPELPSVAWFRAAVWAAILAVLAGGWGIQRQRLGRVPRPPFAIGVAVSVAIPLAVATVLCLIQLAANVPAIVDTQARVATSGTDQAGLLLLQLGYLPNLILWAASFVLGPGFSVGADHVLSPFVASVPVVPDVPVLTAIPADPPNWTAVLPITVALSGALGSLVFARLLPEPRLRRRITRALTLAAASGVVWWVLLSLAGGSLGAGRLEALGPVAGAAFMGMILTAAGSLMWALLPTLASDARPVAIDLRDRVTTAAKDGRIPVGRRT